jgi:hypothetical protein
MMRMAPAVAAVSAALGAAASDPSSTAGSPPVSRAWRVHVSAPAQFDFTIARLRFSVAPRGRHPRLDVRLAGPNGLNFVASARPVRQPRGGLVALVVAVNRRPRGSLAPDLQRLDLTARLSRVARRPQLGELVDVYGAPTQERRDRRAVCSIPGSRTLAPRDLVLLTRAGNPPAGYSARDTIVQAFHTACQRPVDPRFREAVQGSSPPPPPVPPPPPPPCACEPGPGMPCPDAPPPPCPQPVASPR